MNNHAFLAGVIAGGDKAFNAFHLYDTGAASANLVNTLQKAEGGDGCAGDTGRVQNGSAFFHLNFASVDCEI
jgi:hypothetical protein